jgi:Ca2+-binding EF-hand superfamily protein
VTSDDFVKHVQEGLRIKVDKDEILDLIRTVDVENKGYFDYIGFSKIFTT